jgi:hypothetical protein
VPILSVKYVLSFDNQVSFKNFFFLFLMKKRRLRQNEKRERAAGRKVRMIDNDETFEKKTFQK